MSDHNCIRKVLTKRVLQAISRVNEASITFNEVIGRAPGDSRLPNYKNLKDACRDFDLARIEMRIAHQCLNKFLKDRVVPEHLD